jgi:hypothetical protein
MGAAELPVRKFFSRATRRIHVVFVLRTGYRLLEPKPLVLARISFALLLWLSFTIYI